MGIYFKIKMIIIFVIRIERMDNFINGDVTVDYIKKVKLCPSPTPSSKIEID